MNEITYDNSNNLCAIGSMSKGTVFRCDSGWYMLTDEASPGNATAVSLITGDLKIFRCNDKFEVFTGILHINCR